MTEPIDPLKQRNEETVFRDALRRECILAREALPTAVHARASASVLGHLYTLLAHRAPALLGFYWPIRAEVDCRPLVMRLLQQGWTASLPHISERHAAMGFRRWTPDSVMGNGEHGIPTVANPDAGETSPLPDVLLLPVNAFDREGHRLGYGGGYYDRTLAAMPVRPYVVGIGFELARVASIRPHAQDAVMDAVVTEQGIDVFS